MKKLRALIAFALVCGMSGLAKAASIGTNGGEFQMIVIDPSYSVNTITSTSFSFTLSPCVAPGQVPTGTAYIGCFTGQNETGAVLTSLDLTIPSIPNGSPACAPYGSGLDVFTSITCGTNGNGYYLLLSGGSIAVDDIFTFAEAGVDPSVFGTIQAVATAATPEPNSLWLLATGLLGLGFYAVRRQRTEVALNSSY